MLEEGMLTEGMLTEGMLAEGMLVEGMPNYWAADPRPDPTIRQNHASTSPPLGVNTQRVWGWRRLRLSALAAKVFPRLPSARRHEYAPRCQWGRYRYAPGKWRSGGTLAGGVCGARGLI